MNKVILHGRLARDPETTYTSSGKAVAQITIACDRNVKKEEGNPNQVTADFISCVVWDKQAELVGNYFSKGKEILVEGRIQVRSYQNKAGERRWVTEVVVERIEFCGKKSDYRPEMAPPPDDSEMAGIGNCIPPDDDIPF